MEEKNVKNKKVLNFIIKIFWIFIIGSIFGFFAEMIYRSIFSRSLQIGRGLIYGPFIQIYGMGAIAYYILIKEVKEPKDVFIYGTIMGGVLEYLCSFFQEMLFNTISWDYSKFFLNLNGRVCLLYCVYWGIIALMFLKIVYPWFQKIEPLIYKKGVRIFTIFLAIFMAFDIFISVAASERQEMRHKDVQAQNKFEEFLDNTYPDKVLDKIYNNKKEVK